MADLSIVLPISDKDKARRNIDRAKLLFRSLNYFWKEESKVDVYVVAPDDELSVIESALKIEGISSVYKLHFVNETSVHPSISAAPPGYGIARHMLIKLAAPIFIKTNFYLIFDTDVVACKFMSTNNFIRDGKALSEYCNYPNQYPWFINSARVLRIPEDSIDFSVPRLFVTPAILSSEIVISLHENLSRLSGGRHWIDYLIAEFDKRDNHYWTEYTLYDIFAQRTGVLDQFHLGPYQEKPLHCMEQGIWTPEDFNKWVPEKAFDGRSPGYFMVLQSITGADVSFDNVRETLDFGWSRVRPSLPGEAPQWTKLSPALVSC